MKRLTSRDAPTGHKLFNFISRQDHFNHVGGRTSNVRQSIDHMLTSIEIKGDLEEPWATEVLDEFYGQTREDIFWRLIREDPDNILSAFSIISPIGFSYFLPVFFEFSESEKSHGCGWQFPSWMAHALANQLRIQPDVVIFNKDAILRLIESVSTDISRFGTSEILHVDEVEDLAKFQALLIAIQEAESGPRE